MKYFISIIFACTILFPPIAQAQYNNVNTQGQFITTQSGLLDGATVFTIEFWVKTTENRGNDIYWQRPYLFGNETNGNNSGDLGITTNFGYIGMWEGVSTLNNDQQFLSPSTRINDNLWHHIAAVNNGQTINLYVDGNIVGSLVSGKRLTTFSAPLTFGAASLNHGFPGNQQGNINFVSEAYFGQARISKGVRYGANFIPKQIFPTDAFTLASFQFDSQNYNTRPLDPNQPVSFDPSEAINNNAAKPATLYINDGQGIEGRIFLGKKDWSLNAEIGIHFFEGNSRKAKFYRAEEIKGFQIGDSYYEPKFLGAGGAINTSLRKTIVKRLTPAENKMAMYEYENESSSKNSNGYIEYKTTLIYFVQLPGTTDDKIYQFSDNKFTPHFDSRVSALLQDKPALADKIRSKDKDFFYSFITDDKHQLRVWWNIINEYNKP